MSIRPSRKPKTSYRVDRNTAILRNGLIVSLMFWVSPASSQIDYQQALPTAYDMWNGEVGTYEFLDEIYNGSGNPTIPLAPLTGGLGDLTDGLIAVDSWQTAEAPPGNGPYVGWMSVDPEITFHFSQNVAFQYVSVHFYDSDGVGSVRPPLRVEVTVGSNPTRVFTTGDLPGPLAYDFTMGINGDTGDRVDVQIFRRDSSWIMISEVQFYGDSPVPAVPYQSLILLGVILFAVSRATIWRYQTGHP